LQITARAAEAFAEAIKELAYVIDPSLVIRVELVNGTEASLSLNSIIRVISGGDVKELSIRALVFSIVWWFTQNALDYGFEKVMDLITGEGEAVVHLSHEEKTEIAEMVARAVKGKAAQPEVQEVYRELEKDTAIRGVGAATEHGKRPRSVVPRAEFSLHGGYTLILEEPTKRKRISIERVVLVRPVLKAGSRRWRFAFREGEFGAPIKDTEGLTALLQGAIPMTEGIELDVELETVEEKRGTVWVPVERNILRVIQIHATPIQRSLNLITPTRGAKRGTDHNVATISNDSKNPTSLK
jgi:hypothetical protein